jgi:hypothetical protein
LFLEKGFKFFKIPLIVCSTCGVLKQHVHHPDSNGKNELFESEKKKYKIDIEVLQNEKSPNFASTDSFQQHSSIHSTRICTGSRKYTHMKNDNNKKNSRG